MTIQTNNSHDMAWILEQIECIAKIGQDESGVTRLAFSQADHQARKYITELMQTIGLTVHIDAVGNIIGRFTPKGVKSDVPAVVTGSHLDTVPSGGKYDGVLGLVCGLAAVRRLQARENIKHPLEVVIFIAEESSRFSIATMGSKAMAGLASYSTWKKIKDQKGVSFSDELSAIGLSIEHIGAATRTTGSIKGFVELHIEHGQILEQGRIPIGIVEKVSAPTRLKVTVTGTAGHSGSRLRDRQDALVSAAMIVLAVRNIAAEYDYQDAVATVTILNTYPNAINVIPGKVEMRVDIRGMEHACIVEILQEIKDAVSSIAEDNDTPVFIEVLSSEKPITLNENVNQTIENICCNLKLPCLRLDSCVGHDTMNIAHIAPAGLIFVPSKDGISHNGSEHVTPEDIATGLEVLTETLYQLAK